MDRVLTSEMQMGSGLGVGGRLRRKRGLGS